ncbi:MAG: DNA-directed RNA polymerase subunit omega, partial [Candidatus Acidiferrales bacterium]
DVRSANAMIPVDKIESKFSFVLAAAKRARQLQGGAKPLIHTQTRKPTGIAMEEVIAGLVPHQLPGGGDETDDGKGKKSKSKRASK